MRHLVTFAAIAMTTLAGLHAAPRVGTDARANELIRGLNVHVLPREAGYLGILGRSAQMMTWGGRQLAVQSQNYYMLTRSRRNLRRVA